jgi:hypothetical protein
MSIKVGKSKKTLDISNKSSNSPINNGLNLIRIHVNVISKGLFIVVVLKKEKFTQEFFLITFYKLHLHETNLNEKIE